MGLEIFKNLKYLNLSGNNLNNENVIKILNYISKENKIKNYKFENLILSNNNLTQNFLIQFLQFDNFNNLRLLNFSGNKKIININDTFIILKLIKKFKKLKRIDLSNTEFEDETIKFFLHKFNNFDENLNKFNINYLNIIPNENDIENLLIEIKKNNYQCKIIINDKVNLKQRFKSFDILSNN